VTSLDNEKIQLEVRLENREVPRSLVSHIFWLHPDELDPSLATAQTADEAGRIRVQAFRNDGFRLTFEPVQLEAGTLSGTSDVLGSCRTELATLDQLIIGSGIEQSVAQLAYHRWKLKNAVDPRYVTEGEEEGSGGDSGTGSALVGKLAPDFQLDLLDGTKFQLSAQRGKIVVLDFWATWCGPCVRAMPLVEAAVGEFPKDQVRLIAVNLQEQPKQITTMLQRHKLDVTVALDVDGVAAERYEASSIPQTVIIDRDGKIARLYVGGDNDLGDNIRSALRGLIETPPAQGQDP
jgi:thiol-disulfide isomerase/thioredoxin